MKVRWFVFGVVLVLAFGGCKRTDTAAVAVPVPVSPVPLVKTLCKQTPEPATNEVDIVFHGLVAFVFIKADHSLKSVFLNPSGAEHQPLCSISTKWIDDRSPSNPDFVATGNADAGLAVWKFTEISADTRNVDTTNGLTKDDRQTTQDPTNCDLVRWIPTMDDIFGTKQEVLKSEIANAGARGIWTAGNITAIFDDDAHKGDTHFDIGLRKQTAIADGLRLRLKLTNTDGLKLNLDGNRTVWVQNGGTILLSAYATKLPKSGDELKDFRHFFLLIRSGAQVNINHLVGPGPRPPRCAPALFYPEVDPS